MLQRTRIPIVGTLLALMSACGPSDNDPGPGGVTVGEARALDEAAEMIEQQRLPQDALPPDTGADAPRPPQPENPHKPGQ